MPANCSWSLLDALLVATTAGLLATIVGRLVARSGVIRAALTSAGAIGGRGTALDEVDELIFVVKPGEASAIAEAVYTPLAGELLATFTDGMNATYGGVSLEKARGLAEAQPKGAYFNANIRE